MKRELQCMEPRSHNQQIILALEKEMNRMQADLQNEKKFNTDRRLLT